MPGHDSIRDTLADPLPTVPGKKRVIDWTARYRATTLDVQRYSRFVGVMKRALPMAAAALLLAVVAYSLQPRIQNSRKLTLTMQKIGILNNDLMMIKPKLTGMDGEGNPYVVTAEEAVQDIHDSKRAQLHHVEADMSLKNGQWLNLTATRGWLDETKQKLRLQGTIDVYSDRGFEAHTTLADVDMRTGVVWGSVPINGQGPLGTFRADRFKIDRGIASKHPSKTDAKQDKTKIYLYGNVQMTIYKTRTAHS